MQTSFTEILLYCLLFFEIIFYYTNKIKGNHIRLLIPVRALTILVIFYISWSNNHVIKLITSNYKQVIQYNSFNSYYNFVHLLVVVILIVVFVFINQYFVNWKLNSKMNFVRQIIYAIIIVFLLYRFNNCIYEIFNIKYIIPSDIIFNKI